MPQAPAGSADHIGAHATVHLVSPQCHSVNSTWFAKSTWLDWTIVPQRLSCQNWCQKLLTSHIGPGDWSGGSSKRSWHFVAAKPSHPPLYGCLPVCLAQFSHGVAPHCTCPTACPTTLALDTSPAWQLATAQPVNSCSSPYPLPKPPPKSQLYLPERSGTCSGGP